MQPLSAVRVSLSIISLCMMPIYARNEGACRNIIRGEGKGRRRERIGVGVLGKGKRGERVIWRGKEGGSLLAYDAVAARSEKNTVRYLSCEMTMVWRVFEFVRGLSEDFEDLEAQTCSQFSMNDHKLRVDYIYLLGLA